MTPEKLTEANERIKKLESTIRKQGSLYYDGKLCFCDMRIGNPMVNGHSDSCKELRKLISYDIHSVTDILGG